MISAIPEKRITIQEVMKSRWISQCQSVPRTPLPSLEESEEFLNELRKCFQINLDNMRKNSDLSLESLNCNEIFNNCQNNNLVE